MAQCAVAVPAKQSTYAARLVTVVNLERATSRIRAARSAPVPLLPKHALVVIQR